MQTTPVTPDQFAQSVLAVPPLARNSDRVICENNNRKIVQHLESGGVSMLLYGGNANLYHVRPSEYGRLLETLQSIAADDTLIIPSVGPAYGTMIDQAEILKETDFPTAMVLPTKVVMTEAGLMTGIRHFVEAVGRPAVLYIKEEGYISPEGAAELVDDGLISFIKYAIVRDNPAEDEFLERLMDRVDTGLVCSGIGEQPAIIHMKKFGCIGYTSGCVCVNPTLSQQMLAAIGRGDVEEADRIRKMFVPLEDLRNNINPIRVLHEAVSLAGIGETGPHLPLLSGVAQSSQPQIAAAAKDLLALSAG